MGQDETGHSGGKDHSVGRGKPAPRDQKGSGKKPKFQRRAEARPDEMLDAALALFLEKGFEATRVEDVARRAGISKGTVYLYFASKEALLEGLVRRAIVPVATTALSAVQDYRGDPRIIITMVMKMLAGRFSDPKLQAIPHIIMREVVRFPRLAEIYRNEVLDRVIPVMIGLFERGIADGFLRPIDPELTVRSIMGPIILHILLAEVFGVVPKGGLALDRLIDNHLIILFDGLAVPKGAQNV